MPTAVLLAWELGSDYGHLTRFLLIAQRLRLRGFEPVVVLRDLAHFETVFGGMQIPVFQAPLWLPKVSGLPPAASYSETLMRVGFLDPGNLTGICRAWRHLIAAVAPRLLVFDFAPTGLLATRSLGIPRAALDTGFSAPPRSDPLPAYRWWRPEPAARLVASDRKVVAVANEVLATLSARRLSHLADLRDVEESFLCTIPELDQYPKREAGVRYWGSVQSTEHGVAPRWDFAGGKRVFAYLKPRHRDFERVLLAMREVEAVFLVHAPGASAKAVAAHTAANVTFSVDPVRMRDVLASCDAAICHAGAGTVQAMLTAGRPLLLLPEHLEQMMTAKRAAQLGAAVVVDFESSPPDYLKLLRRLVGDPSLTVAAAAIATRYPAATAEAAVDEIVDRCVALTANGATVPSSCA